jgi:hypothetical protein
LVIFFVIDVPKGRTLQSATKVLSPLLNCEIKVTNRTCLGISGALLFAGVLWDLFSVVGCEDDGVGAEEYMWADCI